jgi:hypothetical protein
VCSVVVCPSLIRKELTMLKYIIIIIPLALLAFGLVTACVLMEKAEEVRHGRFDQTE